MPKGDGPRSPNYSYLLWKAFSKDDSDAVRQMAEKDPVGVKYALYAMWDNGRDFIPHRPTLSAASPTAG